MSKAKKGELAVVTDHLRSSPHFNPWLGADVTSANFQRMTSLPEELERALLDLPMGALLVKCGLLGASSKYTCVKYVAERFTEEQVRKFVALKHPVDPARPKREDIVQQPSRIHPGPKTVVHTMSANGVDATVAAALKRRMPGAVSQGFMRGDTLVSKTITGQSKITPGSLRAKTLEALAAPKTIDALQAAVEAEGHHFDVRPVLGKLRAAGWIVLQLASQTGDQK